MMCLLMWATAVCEE